MRQSSSKRGFEVIGLKADSIRRAVRPCSVCRHRTLQANDDETKHWAKLQGLRGSQENGPAGRFFNLLWRRRVRWVPAQKEQAGGRLSCRHLSQPKSLKFLTTPVEKPDDVYRCAEKATHSQRGRPRPPAPAKSVRSCAVRGLYSSALGEWQPSAGGGNPGRPDTGEAWAEIAPSQSAGHRIWPLHKRKTRHYGATATNRLLSSFDIAEG